MSPEPDRTMERRSQLLASKLTARVGILREAVAPPGQRPPFTEQLSTPDALNFWQQHRNDATGQKILAQMKPEAIFELDQALNQANEPTGFGGFE